MASITGFVGVEESLTLIVAGHETKASTLNWTWHLLSQHPAVEAKLTEEFDRISFGAYDDLPKFSYTRQVLEEAMRLYPPGWLVTRNALKDGTLGEYFVPEETEIYIPLYFIHRHPIASNQIGFDPTIPNNVD